MMIDITTLHPTLPLQYKYVTLRYTGKGTGTGTGAGTGTKCY